MGRTTFATLGIAAALLASGPACASTLMDVTGAMATDSAASSSSGLGAASALKTVKGSLQRSLPSFTPPKIDVAAPTGATAPKTSRPTTTARLSGPGSTSGGSRVAGPSTWRVGSNGGATPYKTAWTSGAGRTSGSASAGAPGQCWAKAGTVSRGATAGNAWKRPGTTGAH